jgi:hypothetical protein
MDGGYNALHYASLHSKAGVVEALLRMGANVTSRTGDYLVETAMHCAGRGGSIEVGPPRCLVTRLLIRVLSTPEHSRMGTRDFLRCFHGLGVWISGCGFRDLKFRMGVEVYIL